MGPPSSWPRSPLGKARSLPHANRDRAPGPPRPPRQLPGATEDPTGHSALPAAPSGSGDRWATPLPSSFPACACSGASHERAVGQRLGAGGVGAPRAGRGRSLLAPPRPVPHTVSPPPPPSGRAGRGPWLLPFLAAPASARAWPRGRGGRAPAQTRTAGRAQVAGGPAALAAAAGWPPPGLARRRRRRREGGRERASERAPGSRAGAASASHVKGRSRPGERRGRLRSPATPQRGGFPSASPLAGPVGRRCPAPAPPFLGGGWRRGAAPVNTPPGVGVRSGGCGGSRASQPRRRWMRPGGAAEPAHPFQPAVGTRGAAMT